MTILTDGQPAIAPFGTTCARCGYKLRGLPTDGRCPECGKEIDHSVARRAARRNRQLRRASTQRVRSLAGGANAILLSMGLLLLFICAPRSWQELGDSGRVVLLAIVSAAFVIHWFGAWKLSAPPPRLSATRSDLFWARSLRVASIVMVLFPLIWGLRAMGSQSQGWEPAYFGLFQLAAAGATIVFYLNLRQLAAQAGSIRLQLCSCISLAVWLAIFTLWPTGSWTYYPSSLEFMCMSPSFIVGHVEAWMVLRSINEVPLVAGLIIVALLATMAYTLMSVAEMLHHQSRRCRRRKRVCMWERDGESFQR